MRRRRRAREEENRELKEMDGTSAVSGPALGREPGRAKPKSRLHDGTALARPGALTGQSQALRPWLSCLGGLYPFPFGNDAVDSHHSNDRGRLGTSCNSVLSGTTQASQRTQLFLIPPPSLGSSPGLPHGPYTVLNILHTFPSLYLLV